MFIIINPIIIIIIIIIIIMIMIMIIIIIIIIMICFWIMLLVLPQGISPERKEGGRDSQETNRQLEYIHPWHV